MPKTIPAFFPPALPASRLASRYSRAKQRETEAIADLGRSFPLLSSYRCDDEAPIELPNADNAQC